MNVNACFSQSFTFIHALTRLLWRNTQPWHHRPGCPEIRPLCHCQWNNTLRTYEQYVTCATTQRNSTIGLCYGSGSGAYASLQLPSLGASFHNSVYLMPLHTPCFRRLPRVERSARSCSEDSTPSLQACFDCTDWQCFYDACGDNINDLCDTVSSYVTSSQLKRLLFIRIANLG